MADIEEKLAKSLTAESTEIIPFLPYLLQDLWELGSSPKDIIDLISRHITVAEETRVLDLACGKGAVGVSLARDLGCKVTGIDIMPEFIDFAKQKAVEHRVENLCDFKIGDINEAVKVEKGYDMVILGAAGDVLGNPEEAIRKLKGTVIVNGHILIDDVYGKDDSDARYLTREKWLTFFQKGSVKLLDEKFNQEDELNKINEKQQSFIVRRARELKDKHPEKTHLFESYVRSQQAECDELENEISGVTLLLQAINSPAKNWKVNVLKNGGCLSRSKTKLP